MKEPNEIDLLFQSAFDGLELPLDPVMKENIDRAIAAKKKRRRFLFILFPVLLGTTGFAAMLYFYPFSEKNLQNKQLTHQNRLSEDEKSSSNSGNSAFRMNESKQTALNDPISEKAQLSIGTSGSSVQTQLPITKKRTHFKSSRSFLNSKSTELPKDKTTLRVNKKSTSPDGKTLVAAEKGEQNLQVKKAPDKLENKLLTEQDAVAITENKPDSTLRSSLTDSTNQIVAEILKSQESNKGAGKWSLAILSYWEGEKKRSADFKDEPYIEQKKENARIHSSTFYGKIEVNRKLTTKLEVLTGLGFRSSKVIQYGYVSKIEIPVEGVGSVNPGPITTFDTVHSTAIQSFRVNSLVLPIGFAYSFPIGKKMQIRLSAGGEFAYGQIANRQLQPDLSAPKFRPFGCSVWLRPEVHYSFGRSQLFGFGTLNQSLSQQLKWNFEPRRNPAFGAGIGLRIRL